MRLDGATSRDGLETINVDHRSVGPTFVQHFFTRHHDSLSTKIFQHEGGGGAVEVIDRFARIQTLEREVSRRLNADATLDNAFAANDSLHQDLLKSWTRRRRGCRHHRRRDGGSFSR